MPTVAELLGGRDAVGLWALVFVRSTFAFRNKTMWGLMTVKGHCEEVRGEGQVTDTGGVSGRLDTVVASLHTGIKDATSICGRRISSTWRSSRRSA